MIFNVSHEGWWGEPPVNKLRVFRIMFGDVVVVTLVAALVVAYRVDIWGTHLGALCCLHTSFRTHGAVLVCRVVVSLSMALRTTISLEGERAEVGIRVRMGHRGCWARICAWCLS